VHVSRNKLQCVARECDEDQRAKFITRMARYSPEELGFIDEVSRNEQVVGQHYGQAHKGLHAWKMQPFVHGQCSSMIRVLSIDSFICRMSVEGSYILPHPMIASIHTPPLIGSTPTCSPTH